MLEPAQGVWGLEIAEAEANSLQRCLEHREYAQPQVLTVFHPKTLGKERGRFEAVCGRQRRAAAQAGGWVLGSLAGYGEGQPKSWFPPLSSVGFSPFLPNNPQSK